MDDCQPKIEYEYLETHTEVKETGENESVSTPAIQIENGDNAVKEDRQDIPKDTLMEEINEIEQVKLFIFFLFQRLKQENFSYQLKLIFFF